MRRFCLFTLMTLIIFMAELLLFNIFGRWFTPQLLLLFIVFTNSYCGIRYSLWVAFLAGLFKDSFGLGPFGVYISSFIVCSYATTAIKKYFYELEAGIAKVVTAFLISVLNVFIILALRSLHGTIDFHQAFTLIMLPEVLITTLVAVFVFGELRRCALRLSV